MRITPINKDEIAQRIAESAKDQNDDIKANNMLRVSEALMTMGEPGGQFRTLGEMKTKFLPFNNVKDRGAIDYSTDTYYEALRISLKIAGYS